MIEIQNVTKIFPNGVRALNDISVTINKGDFVFLVGPSGAGKSTFLKMLFREEIPTMGKILVDGKDIDHARKSCALPKKKSRDSASRFSAVKKQNCC